MTAKCVDAPPEACFQNRRPYLPSPCYATVKAIGAVSSSISSEKILLAKFTKVIKSNETFQF